MGLVYVSGCLSDYIPRTGKILVNEVYVSDDEDKYWLELYNPNDYAVSLSLYSFNNGRISEPPKGPNIKLKEYSYVIFCKDKKAFMESFIVPKDVEVFEYDSVFGENFYQYGIGLNDASDSDFVDVGFDRHDAPQDWQLHRPPLKYSLSRYRDGYDTDIRDKDFYSDPNPTPGWENSRGKSR